MCSSDLLEAADTWTVYAISGNTEELPRTLRTEDVSPAIRVVPGSVVRIDDAERELDPLYALDRLLLERGLRSGLRAPLVRGETLAGAVSFWSRSPAAFTVEHEAAVRPIAILVGLALEHERLWSLDAARRRRLDAIDSLLLTMAGSLHVREVFNQIGRAHV